MGRPKGSKNKTYKIKKPNGFILHENIVELLLVSPKNGNRSCFIDEEDFDFVKNFYWSAVKQGSTYYAYSHDPDCNGKRKSIKLHRILLSSTDGEIVDHINGNGLDNTRKNLRTVSNTQNLQNRGLTKNKNSSKYKGVFARDSKVTPFKSLIMVNKVSKYLGSFPTELEAALAYNEAALTYFGTFARINEIENLNND